MTDMVAKSRQARGERHSQVKLTQAQIVEIRMIHQPGVRGLGYLALSKRFGVASETIRDVIKGRTWKWFTPLFCAWLLWSKWVVGGEPEIMQAYPAQAKTAAAQYLAAEACGRDAKLLNQKVKEEGLDTGVRYVCLPDTLDPRGPVTLPKPRR